MKKLLFSAAISTFLLAGCSGNKTDEPSNDGTHEHGEGTHEHHANDTAHHPQEGFIVDSAKKEENHEHPHGHDGHDHKH